MKAARRRTEPEVNPENVRSALRGRMELSEDELVAVVRLIRLRRHRTHMLIRVVVDQILFDFATKPEELTLARAEYIFKSARLVMDWENALEGLERMVPCIAKHPAVHFLGPSVDEIHPEDYDEEEQFYQLLKLWRLDHPEPEKRSDDVLRVLKNGLQRSPEEDKRRR